MSEIIPVLVKEIQTHLAPGNEAELTPEYPLIQSGLIDSLSLFKLLTFVEGRFQVSIEPNEIVVENFATLAAIERLVRTKRQDQARQQR